MGPHKPSAGEPPCSRAVSRRGNQVECTSGGIRCRPVPSGAVRCYPLLPRFSRRACRRGPYGTQEGKLTRGEERCRRSCADVSSALSVARYNKATTDPLSSAPPRPVPTPVRPYSMRVQLSRSSEDDAFRMRVQRIFAPPELPRSRENPPFFWLTVQRASLRRPHAKIPAPEDQIIDHGGPSKLDHAVGLSGGSKILSRPRVTGLCPGSLPRASAHPRASPGITNDVILTSLRTHGNSPPHTAYTSKEHRFQPYNIGSYCLRHTTRPGPIRACICGPRTAREGSRSCTVRPREPLP